MRWKIGGIDAETGRPWQVTILARDAADAANQARLYQQTPIVAGDEEQGDLLNHTASRHAPSSPLLTLLLFPLIALALCAKIVQLVIGRLRRMIVS